jgi:hypothetical protein
MSVELKKKFLVFTTGSDRAPIVVLSKMVITIESRRCSRCPILVFFTFGLPNYPTEAIMRTKVLRDGGIWPKVMP